LIIRVLQGSAQTTNPFFPFNTFIAYHNNTTNISFQYGGNNLSGILLGHDELNSQVQNLFL
jgi:hypothetical protein